MAKAIIASILESQLGKYIEGLSGDSLHVGFWSGEIALQNVRLKHEAILAEFEDLQLLPLRIVHGSIKKINIYVPWNQLTTSSVRITIQGVTLLLAPNTVGCEEVDHDRSDVLWKRKQSQLERYELIRRHAQLAKANNQAEEDESTFLSRLTHRIIEHIQVTLCDVHFRYEDDFSCQLLHAPQSRAFACGITLEKLALSACDAKDKLYASSSVNIASQQNLDQEYSFKKLSIESFGVYIEEMQQTSEEIVTTLKKGGNTPKLELETVLLDAEHMKSHQFVISPSQMEVYLIKRETSFDTNSDCKYNLQSCISSINISLSRTQYQNVIMLHRASRMIHDDLVHRQQQSRNQGRPLRSASARPRDWWDYIVSRALPSRSRKMTWSSILQSCRERKLYIATYTEHVRAAENALATTTNNRELEYEVNLWKAEHPQEAAILENFEKVYPIEFILKVRNHAEECERNRSLEQKLMQSTTQQETGKSWYKYFFGSSSKQNDSLASSIMSEQAARALQEAYAQAIEKEQQKALPALYDILRVKLQVEQWTLTLLAPSEIASSDAVESSIRLLAPLVVVQSRGCLAMKLCSTLEWSLKLNLDHFEAENKLITSEMIDADNCNSLRRLCTPISKDSENHCDSCFSLKMKYSYGSSDCRNADNRFRSPVFQLRLSTEPLKIVVDPRLMVYLFEFFHFSDSEESANKVTMEDQESSWRRRTTTVTEWISSYDDTNESNTKDQTSGASESPETLPSDLHWDILVNVNAPVIVFMEEDSGGQDTAIVIVDLGHTKLVHDDTLQIDRSNSAWTLYLREMRIFFGPRDQVDGRKQLLHDIDLEFALAQSVSGALFRIKAGIPKVAITISEDQIEKLNRLYQAFVSKALETRAHADEMFFLDAYVSKTASFSASSDLRLPTQNVFLAYCEFFLDEMIIDIVDSYSYKELFAFSVSKTTFSADIWTHHNSIHIELQSLKLIDGLYDISCPYHHLIDTKKCQEDSSHLETLLFVDIRNYFSTYFATQDHDAVEANCLVDVSFNTLQVQWNPSSIGLLYRLLHLVPMFEQKDMLDSQHIAIDQELSSKCAEGEDSTRPSMIIHTSLVEFSVAFNKDEMDRPLVRLIAEDANVVGKFWSTGNCDISGHLGDFVMKDLTVSHGKHNVYVPLIGLHHRQSEAVSGDAVSLLQFCYKSDQEGNSLDLFLRPIRMIYYHQQLLELADYFIEGVLKPFGLGSEDVWVTASQLLLDRKQSSVRLSAIMIEPSIVLPMQWNVAQHIAITADKLTLEHDQSASIEFDFSLKDETREAHQRYRLVSEEMLPVSSGHTVMMTDLKRVVLSRVNVFCVVDGGKTYQPLFSRPIQSSVDVIDTMDQPQPGRELAKEIPRFTVSAHVNECNQEPSKDPITIDLNREQYLTLVAVLEKNLAADEAIASDIHWSQDDSRPQVEYSYARSDVEAVAVTLAIWMTNLRCRFVDASQVLETDAISISLDVLTDQDPTLTLTLKGLKLGKSEDQLLLISTTSTRLLLTWKSELSTSTVAVDIANVRGWLEPDLLLELIDFLELPSVNVLKDELQACSNATAILQSSEHDAQTWNITLVAKEISWMLPKTEIANESVQLACSADIDVHLVFEPHEKAKLEDCEESTKTGRAVLIKAKSLQFYSMSQSRTDGTFGHARNLQILEPCDVQIDINDVAPHEAQKQLIVSIQVSPVDVYLSYKDCRNILWTYESIANTVHTHFVSKTERENGHNANRNSLPSTLITAKGSNSGNSELIQWHRHFTLECTHVVVTVINDCEHCDMGLAQLRITNGTFFANINEQLEDFMVSGAPQRCLTISGGGSLTTHLMYLNPQIGRWHPMCSPWQLEATFQGALYQERCSKDARDGRSNEMHVLLNANSPLKVIVTQDLMDLFVSAMSAFERQRDNDKSLCDIPLEMEPQSHQSLGSSQLDAPILLRNITGLDLNVAISSQASKLLHGDIMCVWPTHRRGKGSGVVRRHDGLNSLRLDLLDFGQEAQFEPVLGISLQRIGSQSFPMVPISGVDDNSASQSGSLVVNVKTQLVDGRLFVSLSSLVKVVNHTTLSIQVLVHSSSWKDPVIVGTIASKDSLAVPVLLAWASELRVRPVFPKSHAFGWSAPVPIQTRSRLELELESSCAWASAYFCVRMAFKQSLRIVTFRYPISVVNKLPVPLGYKTRNAMATDKRTVDSSVLKDRENEVIPVGGSSGIWWCTVHQRPLFKLLINGYSSTKWMEWLQNRLRGEESMLEIVVPRTDGGSLKVLLQISEIGRSIQISILSPIWMINRTGLDLVYGSELERDSYFPGIDARSRSGNAQFCVFGSNVNGKTAPKFRIGIPSAESRDNGVMWSALFEADPKYLNWQDECLSIRLLPDRSGSTVLYEFGISSDVATSYFGSVTTLVSILPRFLVQNLSRHTILLTESHAVGDAHAHLAAGADHIIARNELYALYWMQGRRSSVRFSAVSEHPEGFFSWSEAYHIDRVTSWKLLLRHNQQNTVVSLRVAINIGSLTQASYLITIYDEDEEERAGTESTPTLDGERLRWEKWIIDAHMVGGSVTVEGSSKLKTETNTVERGEKILCCSIRNVQLKLDENTETKCAHLNVESLSVRDLTQNLVVLEPLESISLPSDPIVSFVEVLLIEKPTDTKGVHGLASKYYEVVHVKTQSVRISATMQFVNRLNRSFQNTLAHVSSTKTTISAFSTTDTSLAFDMEDTQGLDCDTCEDLLTLFGPSTSTSKNQSMASVTGPKVYVHYLRIDPIGVIFSFSRNDSPDANSVQFSSNFWLKHFKIKLENAHLTLGQFEIKEALATQEALLERMTGFYVKSVKSQALEMLESIKVTSLVSSVVTTGLSSIVSSIIGKSDPQLASHIQESDAMKDGNEAQNQCVGLDSVSSIPLTFTYTPLSNSHLLQKHSHLITLCTSETQFFQEIQHLIYDWDSNHTGILARGCVALGIYNNSHDALMLAARLQDGAELRILPFGRTHLASSINSRGNWDSKRSAIVFAWGYTPTLLTTGDVYLTLSSNACNVYATRRSARLKALKGYTATFTHQQRQKWWTYNIVLVSDELSDVKISKSNEESESTPLSEYECAFSERSIGLVVSQSAPKSVRVYKCCERLLNGEIGPAFASGRIRVGDEIESVNGQKIFSTSQFKDIVMKSSRPVTIRFCRRRQRQTEASNLFGEAK